MKSDRHGDQATPHGYAVELRPAFSGDGFSSWPGAWLGGDGANDSFTSVNGDGSSEGTLSSGGWPRMRSNREGDNYDDLNVGNGWGDTFEGCGVRGDGGSGIGDNHGAGWGDTDDGGIHGNGGSTCFDRDGP